MITFIGYPKCSTSRKARKWLDDHGVEYAWRHIVDDNPTAAELAAWHKASGLPLRRLFNTSGMLYREQNIKAKLDAGLPEQEAYELLSTSGMLVKRPILLAEGAVLFGFKESDWEKTLL